MFTGHQNNLHSELDACFTPNAEYVLAGSEDCLIYAWRAEGSKLAKILKGHSSIPGGQGAVQPQVRRGHRECVHERHCG